MKSYYVEIDGAPSVVEAESLAEVCNKVRGTGRHIKIWSPSGLQLIDTQFGDNYNLVQ